MHRRGSSVRELDTLAVEQSCSALPELSDFIGKVSAACSLRRSQKGERYSAVAALLLTWDDDNAGVSGAAEELGSIWANTYRYHVDSWRIPTHRRRHAEFVHKVDEFVTEHGKEDCLMIIYYGGMARRQTGLGPVWTSSADPDSASIAVAGIAPMLTASAADKLLLVASNDGMPGEMTADTEGIVSAITGTSVGPQSPESQQTFTKCLVEEFSYLATKREPISDARLQARLLERSRRIADDESDNHFTVVPIYRYLSTNNPQRPIYLWPEAKEKHRADEALSRSLSVLSRSSTVRSMTNWKQDPKTTPVTDVLISVRLQSLDIRTSEADEWAQWLLGLPEDVEKSRIQMESIYPGEPTLLIVRLPVETWNLIRRDPCMSFIAFVKEDNAISIMDRQNKREAATRVGSTTASRAPPSNNDTRDLSSDSEFMSRNPTSNPFRSRAAGGPSTSSMPGAYRAPSGATLPPTRRAAPRATTTATTSPASTPAPANKQVRLNTIVELVSHLKSPSPLSPNSPTPPFLESPSSIGEPTSDPLDSATISTDSARSSTSYSSLDYSHFQSAATASSSSSIYTPSPDLEPEPWQLGPLPGNGGGGDHHRPDTPSQRFRQRAEANMAARIARTASKRMRARTIRNNSFEIPSTVLGSEISATKPKEMGVAW